MNSTTPAQIRTFLAQWALPVFMTRENKYRAGVGLALFATFVYVASNHIYLFPPRYLPMWWIDEAVPFMPWSVWIYLSEYVFFPIVYLACKDLTNLNKYFYSFLFLQSVSVIIFWLWPTTYPRELYPLPENIDFLTHFAFSSLRATDTPASCCPSLHVSSVYLSAFLFLDDQKSKFPYFFIWATAIACSTMTTKQHYIIDVLTGCLMALGTYWIFHRYISYRTAEA